MIYPSDKAPVPTCEVVAGCGRTSEFFVPGSRGPMRSCPEHAGQTVREVTALAADHLVGGAGVESVHHYLTQAHRQMIAGNRR